MMSTTDPTSTRAAVGRGLAQSAAGDVVALGDFTNFVHMPDRREAPEPREIAFEDIRAGDEIRSRRVVDGVVFTREGVAHENHHGGWFTSEDGVLVTTSPGATITLLHRPAPEEPKGLSAAVRARVPESLFPSRVRTLVRTANPHVPWVDEKNYPWAWADLDPDSVEVLSEGLLEVES